MTALFFFDPQDILKLFSDTKHFMIVAHSLGSLLSLHIVKSLEAAGKTGKLIAIDGSPLMIKTFRNEFGTKDEMSLLNVVLMSLITSFYPDNDLEIASTALKGTTYEQKLESFIKFSNTDKRSKMKFSKNIIDGLCNRMLMTLDIDLESFPVLKTTKLCVVVPTKKLLENLPEDLGLGRYTENQVECSTIDGTHISVVKNSELIKLLQD